MNLNYIAPLNSLGYGCVGINLLKEFDKKGVNVTYFPIGHPHGLRNIEVDNDDIPMVQKCIARQDSYDARASTLTVWHQNDLALRVGVGMSVGFPIFELDNFNQRERHHLENLDHVIVTSQWAKNVIVNATDINEQEVTVAPLGVNRNIFYDTLPPQNDKIIFINIGKWEVRKGHDFLADAFLKAFKGRDDVELWMMNHNPFCTTEELREWMIKYKDNKIKILGRVLKHSDVANIMRKSHVGIFPSLAEGWNLELLEMMSVGRQVIATNYSAHTEFCDENNCFLINGDKVEPAYDGKWFHGETGNWLAFNYDLFDQLVEQLRQSYEKAQIKNTAGVETAKKFNWSNCAEKILSCPHILK